MHRFLPQLLNISAVASAILSAETAIYTSEQLMQIKSRITKIDGHLASLIETISEQHDQLVTITKATDLLYEYTNKIYRMLTEKLTNHQCKEHQKFEFLTRRNTMKARLYADFESALTAAFSGQLRITEFKILMATTANCAILAVLRQISHRQLTERILYRTIFLAQ